MPAKSPNRYVKRIAASDRKRLGAYKRTRGRPVTGRSPRGTRS